MVVARGLGVVALGLVDLVFALLVVLVLVALVVVVLAMLGLGLVEGLAAGFVSSRWIEMIESSESVLDSTVST